MDRTPEAAGPFDCARARSLIVPEGAGALEEAARRGLHDHLAACAACRALAIADDPALLFLELRGGPLPDAFWAGFSEALRARLPERRLDWAAPLRYPALAYVTAPLVTLLVVGAALVAVRPDLVPWRHPAGIRSPYALPAGPVARPDRAPRIEGSAPGSYLPPGGPGSSSPGRGPAPGDTLEEVGSPGARIYRFSVGGPGDETPIYFVVDESIDI